ncbi:hypothetical protein [Mucilaginibacter sp. UYCu711]|uniref:hypothetical protein n=1 Tax=Mucilaginibacter sp. UYCu711 TaxID=3156339 RepID=UPI003D1BF45E
MKKAFTLFTVLLFSLATLTQAAPADFQKKSVQHLTKSGMVDKRYSENKHLTKGG